MARKTKEIPGTRMSLHGFTRVQLKKNGEINSDSGWVGPNMILNGGVQQFIMNLIGKTTGSLQVAAMALGTGGAPASDATSIAGEYGGTAARIVPAVATTQRSASNATATLQFSGSWGSGSNSGNSNISNIGLFDLSNAQGSCFAGNSYASSQWSNNQDVFSFELDVLKQGELLGTPKVLWATA